MIPSRICTPDPTPKSQKKSKSGAARPIFFRFPIGTKSQPIQNRKTPRIWAFQKSDLTLLGRTSFHRDPPVGGPPLFWGELRPTRLPRNRNVNQYVLQMALFDVQPSTRCADFPFDACRTGQVGKRPTAHKESEANGDASDWNAPNT